MCICFPVQSYTIMERSEEIQFSILLHDEYLYGCCVAFYAADARYDMIKFGSKVGSTKVFMILCCQTFSVRLEDNNM